MNGWRGFVIATVGLAVFQLLVGTENGNRAASGIAGGFVTALQHWVDPNVPLLPTPAGATSKLTAPATSSAPSKTQSAPTVNAPA